MSTYPFICPGRPPQYAAARPSISFPSRWHGGAVVVLAGLVLLAVGLVLGVPGRGPLAAPGPVPPGQVVAVSAVGYVVQPGDTLWSIARALQPSGDVRPLVAQLVAGRRGVPLRAGEHLVLPGLR